jgi:hypothetical protein
MKTTTRAKATFSEATPNPTCLSRAVTGCSKTAPPKAPAVAPTTVMPT